MTTTGAAPADAGGLDAGELAALARLADDVLSDSLDPTTAGLAPTFDPALWSTLEEAGLTLLGVPAEAGGGGAGPAAAALVLAAGATHAAPLPLAETELAGWLLGAAGLPVPGGPLTAAAGPLVVEPGDGGRLSGRLERVPWARDATALVVLAGDGSGEEVVASLPREAWVLRSGANAAGEPRDDVVLDRAPCSIVGTAPPGAAAQFRLRGALARAVQLAAAAERAVALTIRYTTEREQFGRPLARLQVVQHLVAEAASLATAGRAAADAALRIVGEDGFGTERAELAVAVAKARTSAAAGPVAATAHQLHGALGFTLEHPLRLWSTRLWSWRTEFGDADSWHAVVGRRAIGARTPLFHTVTTLS
ncbi:acyl-CoA dehydrogenase family protein [Trujillonella humicola]|uniref:acyl-CoA dehydrogenase family protein n=1 Tax=Trujillonella humicola TaxID=3383699 RepID=UPI0039066665